MPRDDNEYCQRRAEQELERAQCATEPAAVKAHYALAELYLERAAANQDGTVNQQEQAQRAPVVKQDDGLSPKAD